MSIEDMADFLEFFNTEEDVCSLNSEDMGVDYCRTHSCKDCALKYLESQDCDISKYVENCGDCGFCKSIDIVGNIHDYDSLLEISRNT